VLQIKGNFNKKACTFATNTMQFVTCKQIGGNSLIFLTILYL